MLKNLFQANDELFLGDIGPKIDVEHQDPKFLMYTTAFGKNHKVIPWNFLLWVLGNLSRSTTIHNEICYKLIFITLMLNKIEDNRFTMYKKIVVCG